MGIEAADQPPTTDSVVPSAPYVGREHELTVLRERCEVARRGRAGVVLVVGVPGIGKTRLLQEALTNIASSGATTLYGRASATRDMPPYLPFLDALSRHIHATPDDQLRTHLKISPLEQQALETILPELAAHLDDSPRSYAVSLPPTQAHMRLYDAIGTLLATIAGREQVVVLALDDLQWADVATLDLLYHIVHKRPSAQLLIIGACRTGALEQNAALARAVADLMSQRTLAMMSLGPLSAAETLRLARVHLGGPIDSTLSQCLWHQSEGNPFIMEELLQFWRQTHALSCEHRKWVATASLVGSLPPPLCFTVRQWLAQVPDRTLQLLRTAAVIGRTVDASLLATVEGQDVAIVEEALLEANYAQLICLDQSGTFRFSHRKVQECLYDMLGASRRQWLHLQIGEALEARLQQEEGVCAQQFVELARHFHHGGDRARSALYRQRAADEGARTACATEASAFYRSACQAINMSAGQRHSDQLDSERRKGLHTADGQHQERPTLPSNSPETVPSSSSEHTAVLPIPATLRAAHQVLEDALSLLGDAPRPETVCLLLDLAALLTVDLGQPTEGRRHAQQALEMARRLGDACLEFRAMRAMTGPLCIRGGELASSIHMLEQALIQAEIRDDPVAAAHCCTSLATLSYCSGRLRRSWERSVLRATWADQSGQPVAVEQIHLWSVLLCASRGKWSDAERMLAHLRPALEQMASNQANQTTADFVHQVRGFLAYQFGDYDTAVNECNVVASGQPNDLASLMISPGLYGLAHLAIGNHAAARVSMVELERLLAIIPNDTLAAAPLLTSLALIAIGLGEREKFSDLYDRLEPFQGQLYWFLVDRVRGLLATLLGDWAAASQHLEAAEATARREGLLPELARVLAAQADLELASDKQGNAARATDLSTEAEEILLRLRIPVASQHIPHRHLRSPSSPAGGYSWPEYPAGLTPREVSVLQLVAAGKSNVQIARELGLSEKTVTNHLTHIFEKTGSENRAAATAFAIRHEIV